jgi:hypothetical protein
LNTTDAAGICNTIAALHWEQLNETVPVMVWVMLTQMPQSLQRYS